MSSYNNFAEMSNDEQNDMYTQHQPKSFAEMTQPERDVAYREFMKNKPFEDLEKQRDLKTTDTKITDNSSEEIVVGKSTTESHTDSVDKIK